MSILVSLFEKIQKERAQKQSVKTKLVDFEKMIADQARSQGMMPRTYLEQLCQQSESFANSKLVKVLLGEQDVPTQKGRDAKPQVLTKRAMNVVKKGIKHSANKQRRRMDKDAVGEDVKDQFTKLINPMGQDSTSLEKIKQSPGFHKLISTMFASGTQADMEWDEIFSAMSKLLNMNPIEIKAILQQDGMDFSEPDAAERFKQNMGGTGFLGKGKTRTVNSMYEDSHDLQSAYDKVYAYTDKLGDRALEKIDRLAPNFSQAMDQHGEIEDIQANSSAKELQTYKKELELVRYSLELDAGGINEDEAQDRGYAQMIIQQHQDEYKKFMQTGDLMDAPAIYEKLFAYFSSSDADDQMPYGTQKARDGDPYVWLVDKLDELGLIIEEGNEFAQKVRQLKATGAKKGTKFKTSDGEEHTLEQNPQQSRMAGSVSVQQIANQFPEVDDKNQFIQALMKVKSGKTVTNISQIKALAQAFKHMLGMDPMETQQLMTMMKRIKTQEDVSDETIDDFHTELDQLVHKYFGHSSDEKKEKVKEDAITEEEFEQLAEKQDACYHKVKSRYKVWPSAYASGALVQCRKVGASNWGNKSKK